jgi:glyoxylase-like metal-dependent hydrolase (beta-lactamase superfamily II)
MVRLVDSKRELGRGERVPHGNAWAIAAGSGIVLVDCGYHGPGSFAHLERALEMVNLRLEQVRLLVITHAHTDHWGEAATVVERAGCEMWMHPASAHGRDRLDDPEAALARRLEVARQSGVSARAIESYAEQAKEMPSGLAAAIEPDRELVDGVAVETDLGTWTTYETPGHAPSHVCLYQPERRLLISGDHVLGRISLYYDYGYTPDPIGEFLGSLDRIDGLDSRLALSGHGKPFVDVHGHIEGNRVLVHERLEAAVAAAGRGEPRTAVQLVPEIYGQELSFENAGRLLGQTMSYLTHLQLASRLRAERDGDVERWRVVE